MMIYIKSSQCTLQISKYLITLFVNYISVKLKTTLHMCAMSSPWEKIWTSNRTEYPKRHNGYGPICLVKDLITKLNYSKLFKDSYFLIIIIKKIDLKKKIKCYIRKYSLHDKESNKEQLNNNNKKTWAIWKHKVKLHSNSINNITHEWAQ